MTLTIKSDNRKTLWEPFLAKELTVPEKLRAYFQQLSDTLSYPSMQVLASQWSKRYSGYLVTRVLYMMSVEQQGISTSLDHCRIKTHLLEDQWMIEIDFMGGCHRHSGGRESWCHRVLYQLFHENLMPVWRSLQKVCYIPRILLWENTAVYLDWLYHHEIKRRVDFHTWQQCLVDYDYIRKELDGSCFGEAQNPFQRLFEHPSERRKTCCFAYSIKEDYCKNCPHR